MKFDPCFWRHDWDKWKAIEDGKIQRSHDKALIGSYKVQQRQCERCGLVQIRSDKVGTV